MPGSYGTLFVPPENRLQPNIGKVFDALYFEDAKSKVPKPNPLLDKESRELGRLFETGSNSSEVLSRVQKRAGKKKDNSTLIDRSMTDLTFASYSGDVESNSHKTPQPTVSNQILHKRNSSKISATTALILDSKRPGGPFHATYECDSYETQFQAKPSKHAFNADTPKMWPPDASYPVSTLHPQTYDSTVRQLTDTNTFGHPSHAKTLRRQIFEQSMSYSMSSQPYPPNPLMSGNSCSKGYDNYTNHYHTELKSHSELAKSNYCITKANTSKLQATQKKTTSKDSVTSTTSNNQSKFVDSWISGDGNMSRSRSAAFSSQQPPNAPKSSNTHNVSALQQTLLQCGRLKVAGGHHQQALDKSIDTALHAQRSDIQRYAHWLQKLDPTVADSGGASTSTDKLLRRLPRECTTATRSVGTVPSTDDSAVTDTSHRRNHRNHRNRLNSNNNDHKSNRSVSTSRNSVRSITSLSLAETKLSEIGVETSITNKNPFRKSYRSSVLTTIQQHKPRPINPRNPFQYKEELLVYNIGSTYNICIRPEVQIGANPSRSEVSESLEKLTRKAIMVYQNRIVETGLLLHALKDSRHKTPGLAAILDLHLTCLNAAALNVNAWLLNKQQLRAILLSKVTWLGVDSINRLILCYDPQNAGLIRYIRLTTSLLCCLEPSMVNLASSLNRTMQRVNKVDEFSIGTKSSTKRSYNYGGHDSPKSSIDGISSGFSPHQRSQYTEMTNLSQLEYLGESILLRLLHKLYEDCAGGTEIVVVSNNSSSRTSTKPYTSLTKDVSTAASGKISAKNDTIFADSNISNPIHNASSTTDMMMQTILSAAQPRMRGVGMKFDDLLELFTCCVSNIDDELRIQEGLKQLVQNLYQHYYSASAGDGGKDKNSANGHENSSMMNSNFVSPSNHDNSDQRSDSSTHHSFDTHSSTPIDTATATDANMILKHKHFKSLQSLPRIQADDLVTVLKATPEFFNEFNRQVEQFRSSAKKYVVFGASAGAMASVESKSYFSKAAKLVTTLSHYDVL